MITTLIKTAISERTDALFRLKWLEEGESVSYEYIDKGDEPDTACWHWDGNHKVAINECVDEVIATKLKTKDKKRLFTKVAEHELGHAKFTSRDREALGAKLNALNIPFRLWNLFEDARIEHLWRKKWGAFKWLNYMDLPPPLPGLLETDREPGTLFYDLVKIENKKKLVKSWLADYEKAKPVYCKLDGKADATEIPTRKVVHWFYRQAIATKTVDEMLALLVRWIKTFPMPRKKIIIWGDFIGDLLKSLGIEIEDPESAPVDPDTFKGEDPVKIRATGWPFPKLPQTRYIANHPVVDIDIMRANRMINLFDKFLKGGIKKVATSTMSSRINMKRYLHGKPSFFIRKSGHPLGVKRISFIYDTSGSMSRIHQHGVYLIYIINELIRRGRIICPKMLLSGGAPYEVDMPCDPVLPTHINPCGGVEGFARTMRKYKRDLVESDLTIFFTDGNIVDEPIVKAEWHRVGVYTVGMYVSPKHLGDAFEEESVGDMHKYFDAVLVRNTIEAVADGLMHIIKR